MMLTERVERGKQDCVINMHSRVLYFLVWSVIAKAYRTGRKENEALNELVVSVWILLL